MIRKMPNNDCLRSFILVPLELCILLYISNLHEHITFEATELPPLGVYITSYESHHSTIVFGCINSRSKI